MGHRRLWAAVRELGFTLITLGVVVLLFAGYQLWGTGVAEARSQRRLKHEFATASALPTSTTVQTTIPVPTTGPAPPSTSSTSTSAPDPFQPNTPLPPVSGPIAEGQAVGLIRIPRLGVDQAFVQGVGVNDLREGPGHYPGTPYPGEAGNAAIAGHRTTYGAPFYRLNELQPGDPIFIKTRAGDFTYIVKGVVVVRPTQTEILNATPDNRLTLTTCNPRYSASQRLVVVASLQANAPVPSQPQIVPSSPAAGGEVVTGGGGNGDVATVASPALSGDHGAWPETIAWGLAFLALWVATRLGMRRWRPWVPLGGGIVAGLLVLWPFFENISRLLPSNI